MGVCMYRKKGERCSECVRRSSSASCPVPSHPQKAHKRATRRCKGVVYAWGGWVGGCGGVPIDKKKAGMDGRTGRGTGPWGWDGPVAWPTHTKRPHTRAGATAQPSPCACEGGVAWGGAGLEVLGRAWAKGKHKARAVYRGAKGGKGGAGAWTHGWNKPGAAGKRVGGLRGRLGQWEGRGKPGGGRGGGPWGAQGQVGRRALGVLLCVGGGGGEEGRKCWPMSSPPKAWTHRCGKEGKNKRERVCECVGSGGGGARCKK